MNEVDAGVAGVSAGVALAIFCFALSPLAKLFAPPLYPQEVDR